MRRALEDRPPRVADGEHLEEPPQGPLPAVEVVRRDPGKHIPYDPEKVLVITGKAPRVRKDVRYWSLCQNVNEVPLPVVDCASDHDMAPRKDGRYAIAVVGPGQVPDRSAYPNVTFVEWTKATDGAPLKDAFLIWRNILSSKSFAFSVDKVPLGEPATSTMGDYAPVIQHVTLDELSSV